MRIVGSFILCSVFAVAFAAFALRSTYERASLEVCDLVAENYYRREEPKVVAFVEKCRENASRQSFLPSKSANIKRLNDWLSEIRISHLAVYNPDENRMMWENQGLDTGIRSRMVDEHLVVFRVVPGSPADRAGVKAGDAILGIDGQFMASSVFAQSTSGLLHVKRGDAEEIHFDINAEVVHEDLSPEIKDLGSSRALLRLPSFLSQYFTDEKWLPVAKKLGEYDSVIVDLRDNPGGSFPAMLRALSPFLCDRSLVPGAIVRPKNEGMADQTDLRDTLDAQSQIEQLDEAARVNLRPFRRYGCFDGRVTVLIDSGTSSTAEIFAQAFFMRPGSRVWGQPTPGEVVMARWFPIRAFGSEDYSISIPIAGYVTASGHEIESRGIRPQRILYYEAESALRGVDSWVDQALGPWTNTQGKGSGVNGAEDDEDPLVPAHDVLEEQR